jgi:hypothetical protein
LTLGPVASVVVDELRRLEDVGVSHIQIIFADVNSVDRFIDRVLPSFT